MRFLEQEFQCNSNAAKVGARGRPTAWHYETRISLLDIFVLHASSAACRKRNEQHCTYPHQSHTSWLRNFDYHSACRQRVDNGR